MKKLFFCISLSLMGLMTACVDKDEPVDADTKPSWLGGSIYQELKNPDPSRLDGTFTYYLRLVDDLGLAETLDRTGSKTVFPANDEAFQRFFQKNDWGVTSYEQLSNAQKKMLLYNSMLDNALLIGMLSNMSVGSQNGGSPVENGRAMKHQTNINVIDTVQYMTGADMPSNNAYWDKFRGKNMYIVSDATRPMMTHFTREHMLRNGITTAGEESDFAILTGTPYTEGTAFVFNDRVIHSDITCMNGYVHQMEDVIVPPGNMAQVLRRNSDTRYFSRILDYFCAPYFSSVVTENYNAWAQQQQPALPQVDSIFQLRYVNKQGDHKLLNDPDGNLINNSSALDYDPGWNQYSPQASTATEDLAIGDVGAMFIPSDQAVEDFFVGGNGGSAPGAYLIDIYGNLPNTKENLAVNLDSLYSKNPSVLTNFLINLMKPSFVNTVPSKFPTIQNDANEYMGITLDKIQRKADGKYDITIANNGVIYKLNQLIAPDRYQSVMAPSSTYDDMRVMDWLVTEPDGNNKLNVDFSYYLMAMSANFAFFVPDDSAFSQKMIDPTSLGTQQPRALNFYYGKSGNKTTLLCDSYRYDPETNEIGDRIGQVAISQVKSLLIDLLNYHTVVLKAGETLGTNRYYKTKHGGEIRVDFNGTDSLLLSGQQIDNGIAPSQIITSYKEKNGTAYRINHVIESPRNSVYATLSADARFSEFLDVCNGFGATDVLRWAGISDEANEFGIADQDAYVVFTSNRGNGSNMVANSCLDFNVKMFNTYDYTLYAPNNEAMQKAYNAGLPRWDDVSALYEQYRLAAEDDEAALAAKATAKQMIDALRDFTRIHFQSTSVYADNVWQYSSEGEPFPSLSTNSLGLALELKVKGGSNTLTVTDVRGKEHTNIVNANDASKRCNLMARDYWFNADRTRATSIYTSSFCVIHEIDEPLPAYENSDKYDVLIQNSRAQMRKANKLQQKKQNKL